MEVQSVINESALKEARKYLIKPGIRKISAIASAAFVLLAAYCMLTGRPSTMLLAVFAIVIFYGELKMIESKQIKGFLKKLDELFGKKEASHSRKEGMATARSACSRAKGKKRGWPRPLAKPPIARKRKAGAGAEAGDDICRI